VAFHVELLRGTAQRASYKLYVSPFVDDTREALEALIGAWPRGLRIRRVGLRGYPTGQDFGLFHRTDDLYRFSDLLRADCPAALRTVFHLRPRFERPSPGADPRALSAGERTTSWRMW
jgi:hypothetical protein